LEPDWIENLPLKIRQYIEARKYRFTAHALERQNLRSLSIPDIVEVLLHGFHEKEKTLFCTKFQTWKYAIRGKTIDGADVRVVIVIQEGIVIITAIRLPRKVRR
jgi:hypothetical protein